MKFFRLALNLLAVTASAADLTQTLDALVGANPLAAHSNIGVHVVALKTGKPLYARNENRFFLPASNLKLFTTALALERLGPNYRYETRLIEEPAGDLALVGSGDPSFSGRVYPYRPDVGSRPPSQAIDEVAQQAVAAGLTHVPGDVVGDDRLYPWTPFPPNWSQSDALGESGAPVSALSIDDNFVSISFAPGASAGDLAVLSVSPALEYFAIDNRVTTIPGKGEPRIRLTRTPGSRQLLFDGTIPEHPAGTPANTAVANVAVDDPALFAACSLYDALTRLGVRIDGHPVARHRSPGESYQPPEGKTVAVRLSPPVSQLIQMADKVSENLHAELLLREVGRVEHASGSLDNGIAAMNAFLARIGIPATDFRIDDGSGLSRNALVTPQSITHLLGYLYASNLRDTWIGMLPVGGEDGTLARRLCCAAEARRIHAKTGTLNRSIALSGYVDSKTRGWLAFSILVNDFAAPAAGIQAWVDKIALALTE